MKIIKVKSVEAMGQAALSEVLKVVKTKENPVLGLATGSSPIGLYQAMIEDHKKNKTSYQHVKTINLDEYVGIDATHSQSYATFMKEQLFNHIDIDLNNVNIEYSYKFVVDLPIINKFTSVSSGGGSYNFGNLNTNNYE